MNIFRDGSTVNAIVPFEDQNGETIIPVSASYLVFDQEKTEIVASTVHNITSGDIEASITIDGALNTLGVDDDRMMRVVELTMTNAEGSIYTNTYTYVIEVSDLLDNMWNSYQTYEQAQMSAMSLTNIPGWEAATSSDRVKALTEAFHLFGKLNYKVVGDLNNLTEAEFLELDHDFVNSIRLAQVVEADNLLGGNPDGDLRELGLLAKSVGESSQMFRSSKPVVMPVCNRALRLLTGFISYGLNIGRA